MHMAVHMVFCACDDFDGQLNLTESTSPVCEAINMHLFGYQVNEEDFYMVDTNQDGHVTVQEVMDAVQAHSGNIYLRHSSHFNIHLD